MASWKKKLAKEKELKERQKQMKFKYLSTIPMYECINPSCNNIDTFLESLKTHSLYFKYNNSHINFENKYENTPKSTTDEGMGELSMISDDCCINSMISDDCLSLSTMSVNDTNINTNIKTNTNTNTKTNQSPQTMQNKCCNNNNNDENNNKHNNKNKNQNIDNNNNQTKNQNDCIDIDIEIEIDIDYNQYLGKVLF